ncbi:MAG: carboxylesterase/lipase family protein, partial [Candidatus Odinarchaeota archaeon]
VIITINYRLGAFGYLYVPGETANVGQLDQVLALKWVHDNIDKFGGDPNNITIFGESAGAYSVITIAAMPSADGLYRRIIAQSMPTINPIVSDQISKDFLKVLGIKEGDFDALQKIPTEEIMRVQNELTKKGGLLFRPQIDGDIILAHPLTLFKEGKLKNIDLMMGTNLHEAKLFTALSPITREIKDEKAIITYLSTYGINSEKAKNIMDIYKEAQPEIFLNNPKELLDSIATDLMFRIATLQFLEAQSKFQRNSYNYIFTWESNGFNGRFGACHALELPFVFHTLDQPGLLLLLGDVSDIGNLTENMMDAWLSFARTGNPTHDGIPKWPAYDKENRVTLLFGKESKVAHAMFEEERKAWDGIIGNV